MRALFGAERGAKAEPRKILFIKMIEQGATVLAAPAIRRAADAVGRENVYFWVFAENRPILEVLELVPPENVFCIRADRFSTFLIDVIRTVRAIRAARIDTTIDMEFFTRAPAVLAYLTGARRRIGLHRFTSEAPYRGDLMTHRVQYNPYLHASIAYNVLVQAALIAPDQTPLLKDAPDPADCAPERFEPTPEEQAHVRGLLEQAAGRPVERPLVLLNPNASDLLPLRKWPAARFLALGKRILAEHPDVNLVITGAPSEQAPAAELARALGSDRAISIAGKTTLRDVIVLYTLADVMVTNDSGPAHFAALTEMETVILYGPETPAVFGPIGDHAHVLSANLACSPCVNVFNHRFSPCKDNVCMQRISVAQVYEVVKRVMNDE